MEKKYTIIRTVNQYDEYCNELEKLVFDESGNHIDDIELLWNQKRYMSKCINS